MPEMLIGQTFGTGVEVPIEGKAFDNCTFDDCVLVGDKNCIFYGDCTFIGQALSRLEELRATVPMIEMDNRIEIGPRPPVGPFNQLTGP